MKRHLYLNLFLVLAFTLIFNTQAFAESTLYDDFSGTYIDGQKWIWRERVREVVGGKLVSKIGNSTTSSGLVVNSTAIQNPSSINVIQCDITVVATNLDTGTDPVSFAGVVGRFYNKSASGTENGDIFAGVFIGDHGSGLEARWVIKESLDDEGNSWDCIGGDTLISSGLEYETSYTAKIEYDQSNGFTFTLAGESDSFTGPARQGAVGYEYKGMRTGIYSDGGSGTGYASAMFDNVYINNNVSAYDTFDTAPLDQAKWLNLEFVREIKDGKLWLGNQSAGAWSSTSLKMLTENITNHFSSQVSISNSSFTIGDSSVAVKVGGIYYNDTYDVSSFYNEWEGNIYADIRLQLTADGYLYARVVVIRYNNSNGSSKTTLFVRPFSQAINFNTEYTLSIEQLSSSFIFKCNEETITYQISTPIHPSNKLDRKLMAMVYADEGESGYVKGSFDDVCIGKSCSKATFLPAVLLLLL